MLYFNWPEVSPPCSLQSPIQSPTSLSSNRPTSPSIRLTDQSFDHHTVAPRFDALATALTLAPDQSHTGLTRLETGEPPPSLLHGQRSPRPPAWAARCPALGCAAHAPMPCLAIGRSPYGPSNNPPLTGPDDTTGGSSPCARPLTARPACTQVFHRRHSARSHSHPCLTLRGGVSSYRPHPVSRESSLAHTRAYRVAAPSQRYTRADTHTDTHRHSDTSDPTAGRDSGSILADIADLLESQRALRCPCCRNRPFSVSVAALKTLFRSMCCFVLLLSSSASFGSPLFVSLSASAASVP